MVAVHFRIHSKERWKRRVGGRRRQWCRWIVCEQLWPEHECLTLRLDAEVTCLTCMGIKAMWSARGRKLVPLTIRRLRVLVERARRNPEVVREPRDRPLLKVKEDAEW